MLHETFSVIFKHRVPVPPSFQKPLQHLSLLDAVYYSDDTWHKLAFESKMNDVTARKRPPFFP